MGIYLASCLTVFGADIDDDVILNGPEGIKIVDEEGPLFAAGNVVELGLVRVLHPDGVDVYALIPQLCCRSFDLVGGLPVRDDYQELTGFPAAAGRRPVKVLSHEVKGFPRLGPAPNLSDVQNGFFQRLIVRVDCEVEFHDWVVSVFCNPDSDVLWADAEGFQELNDELLHVIKVSGIDTPRVINQEEDVGFARLGTAWKKQQQSKSPIVDRTHATFLYSKLASTLTTKCSKG